MDTWIDEEIAGCGLPDARLTRRLRSLLERMGRCLGESIPFACQDWANSKAAYRFFANARVGDDQILAGHFAATQSRMTAACGPLLIAHDTTEFSFQRETPTHPPTPYPACRQF